MKFYVNLKYIRNIKQKDIFQVSISLKLINYPDTSSLGISPANASAMSLDPIFAMHWRARLKYLIEM